MENINNNSDEYKQFQSYHPFLTYSKALNDRFIQPNGIAGAELNCDTEALFNIGKDSFQLLENFSRDKFDQGYKTYLQVMKLLRFVLTEALDREVLGVVDSNKEAIFINPENLDDGLILDLGWQLQNKGANFSENEDDEVNFIELYAYHALHEIDNSLLGIFFDGHESICAAIFATQALSNANAISSKNNVLIEAKRELALKGAIGRIKRDPKQIALKEITKHYDSNKSQFKRRGFSSQFIREMHVKYPVITDPKTIANLVAKLNKENDEIPR